MTDLDDLRERMRRIDLDLVRLAAERIDLARRVGESKRRNKLPVVDYAQERMVLDRAVRAAEERGLDPRVAEDLFARLIQAAVTVQDEDSLRVAATGAGRSAVILGGGGRMGRWFGRFLSAQGYRTATLDPGAAPDELDAARRLLPGADLVVGSVPPAALAAQYAEWADHPPRGVLVDIASIKSPLIAPIRALQAAGARVASIHPMFGPSVVLLRDADVVVCDTGDHAATAEVEALFAPTTARLVPVALEEHDRIMADLLSLAHAAAIAFALALPDSDHPMRSTTFQALEKLARTVVRESPDVYYEIQARNPHSREAVDRLRGALDRIVGASSAPDAAGFRKLFEDGRRRTSGRP